MENIIIETINTEIINNNDIKVYLDNNIEISSSEPEYDVSVNKKEYVIAGDNLYIPSRYEDAPQWLRDFINTVTDTSLNQKITELNNLNSTLNQLIVELEVAKNTYTNSILTSSDIDERINQRLETLNNSIAQSDATIVDLIATKTTPTQANAIATNVLSTSINSTDNGTIGALVGNVQNAISNLDTALSQNIDTVYAEISGENEINAEAIGSLQAYVGVDSAGASSGTGLSAYLEGTDGIVGSATSNVANLVYTDGGTAKSKFEYNSNLNIAGQNYQSGFGLATSVNAPDSGIPVGQSEFWINASKFKFTNSNKTGATAPFTIDASGTVPKITFNGNVTFGSGQSGTIDQAIAAVFETVSVGDKNINITDNIIPTTSLVADTDNSGYQFVGTPTKGIQSGIDTYAEAQIVLDGTDEVYSPYINDLTIPYYYRFGIKGITSLNRFKIVTINSSNVITYNDITFTMNSGQTLSSTEWYIVDGIINPTGGNTSASGSIRTKAGTKVGTINNFALSANISKVLLGWLSVCTISRMKMCKITADTITSDLTTVNSQLITLQSNIDNVSWNTLVGKDVLAQKLGYGDYNAMVTAASAGQTLINGGYVNTLLLAANSITASKIASYNITAANTTFGNSIIGNAQIIDGSINNAKIANASIDNAKIADASISNAKIGDLSVSTFKIQDEAIVVPRFASGSGSCTIVYTPTVSHAVLISVYGDSLHGANYTWRKFFLNGVLQSNKYQNYHFEGSGFYYDQFSYYLLAGNTYTFRFENVSMTVQGDGAETAINLEAKMIMLGVKK